MSIKEFKNKLSNIRIGLIIALLYFVIIIMSTIICSLFYRQLYLNISQKRISEFSVQTLNSIQTNMDLMINNADSLSQMVLSNGDLQDLLREGSMYEDLNRQAKVGSYLYKLIQSAPYINSVYILDNSNNIYSVGGDILPYMHSESIINSKWYDEVIKKRGSYILKLNGGGVTFESNDKTYVSLIRLVRDVDNLEKLGILIVNIPQKSFMEAFDNISSDIDTNIIILDDEDNKIVSSKELNNMKGKYMDDIDEEMIEAAYELEYGHSGYLMKKFNNTEYLFSFTSNNDYNWKFVSMIPFNQMSKENISVLLIGFIIILINGIILALCSIRISKIITEPIKYLLDSMKDIEKGVFNEVSVKPYGYELKKLCSGYNIMINEIKKLIGRVIEEQKIIRKAELYTFQAQIKPHFLYNTLDSINSLALSNGNNDVSELVESLANYYRISVSKGKEIITIKEEIKMVQNYLKIQKVRYPDMFEVYYEIDEDCSKCMIPKLVLQPLVENALYHGIRAGRKKGNIKIKAHRFNNIVRLSVEDDGLGMSKEKIESIMNDRNDESNNSFGLKGTLERIKIYCGNENAFKIVSKEGIGTKIILFIESGQKENNYGR